VNLLILGDLNQARPNEPGENVALPARRPISNFGYIQSAFGAGFLNYHALQTKVERRFADGLYFLNSFTWSKGIDNASGHLEAQNGDGSRVNIRDLRNERGVSGYNQTLNNTTTLIYDLPFGKGRRYASGWNTPVDLILGGWRMTMINFAASGTPVNLTYSPASQFQVSGAPPYRPNITGDPCSRGPAHARQLAEPRYRPDPHRSVTALRQRRPQHRHRSRPAPDELRPAQGLPDHRVPEARVPHGSLQLPQQNQLQQPERQPLVGRLRDDHLDAAAARNSVRAALRVSTPSRSSRPPSA
jgi:hypothetical protein